MTEPATWPVLRTRSAAESRLYVELSVCDCGEPGFDTSGYTVFTRGGEQIWAYEVTCAECGRERRFEFRAPPRPQPPYPAFGWDEASQIIDPVQFLDAAEGAAEAVPADPAGLDPAELEWARDTMAAAVAAVEEVIKFIPPGQETVPRNAVHPHRRPRYDAEADRYRRGGLTAILGAYRGVLASMAGATGSIRQALTSEDTRARNQARGNIDE